MIERADYVKKLTSYVGVKTVKILCGIRRSGKSTLLEMLKQELLFRGEREDHIITVKYSDQKYYKCDLEKMFGEIVSLITDDGKYYLLLDEVQEIDGWERVVNNLFENYNTEIFVTGSNSKLMSSEISTYLAGRYVTIPVYTLSFKEFFDYKKESGKNKNELLAEYIKMGGFPLVASSNIGKDTAYSIVEDIYNSVVINDIIKKHNITNVDLFERVVKFIFENVGKTFSANSIVNFFKSENRKISVENIYNYIEWLEKAFIIYRCKRYDLRGKGVLKTQEKFYIADQSIKYAIFGFDPTSVSAMLENLVYFELKRRGYDPYIGKFGDKEIDFLAVKRDEKVYVQVCRQMPENSDREIANLLEIKDNYPKIVVTLDEFAQGNVQGVKIVYLADFLLSHIVF